MKYTEKYLKLAHKFSINNKPQLEMGRKCGCFYCQKIYSAKVFRKGYDDWIYGPGEMWGTALCPYCYVDSVISENSGFPITPEFLEVMYRYWFRAADEPWEEE